MQENILHFIWQHQYYNLAKLSTDSGEIIKVLKPGIHNTNAGPDFNQAIIKIGNVEWNGDVEIHIKSNDWKLHKHQFDKAYNRVVLHVVWKKNADTIREDGSIIPTLELKLLVDKKLLKKTENLLTQLHSIACDTQLHNVPNIIKKEVVQRSLIKRLERKSSFVLKELLNSIGDWEEVTYRLLMRQMGMKINGQSFYDLSLIMPYQLIKKYKEDKFKVEALLFGASGLLNVAPKDNYAKELKKEYAYLKHKHTIKKELNFETWKFMRLRPANFPTLRIAQVAAFFSNTPSLFAHIFEGDRELNRKLFAPSSYWKSHYRFDSFSPKKVSLFGKSSVDLIMINVVVPLLMAYGLSVKNQNYINRALQIVEKIKPEKNRITNIWNDLGLASSSIGESQGLIELYNESCLKKKCLDCGIGFHILKK